MSFEAQSGEELKQLIDGGADIQFDKFQLVQVAWPLQNFSERLEDLMQEFEFFILRVVSLVPFDELAEPRRVGGEGESQHISKAGVLFFEVNIFVILPQPSLQCFL